MFTGLLNFMSGKKTYIVAFLMVALGLVQGDTKMVMDGLAFAFLRNAVN
jgi:hypothetical protein